jgi:ABC-type Fe3+-hydroxamate transport system substrate-binding protein
MPRNTMKLTAVLLPITLISMLAACTPAPDPQPVSDEVAPSTEPSYLFVQTAHSVESGEGTLTLKMVSPTTVYFTDRPERIAGHGHTSDFIAMWGEGDDSFNADPPNATLSVIGGEQKVEDIVVTLSNPRLDGQDLTYDVRALEGSLPKNGRAAALFIDAVVLREPMRGRVVIR